MKTAWTGIAQGLSGETPKERPGATRLEMHFSLSVVLAGQTERGLWDEARKAPLTYLSIEAIGDVFNYFISN